MKKNNLSFVIAMFFSVLIVPVFGAKNDIPQWQQDINDRSKDLDELQKQNGAGTEDVKYTEFPKTADDLSFSARVQLEKEGLEPYKNLKAYKELNVKNAEEWCDEHENSRECWEWRCGSNGKDKNKSECIAYRCQNDDYYKTHTEECEKDETELKKQTKSVCHTEFGDLNAGQSFNNKSLADCKDITKTDPNLALVKSWKLVCNNDGTLICKPDSCILWNNKPDEESGKCVIQNVTEKQNIKKEQCTLTSKKFNFSDTDSIFENIQVESPEVAQKIAQEYIKCSTAPDLKATTNYTTESNDDLLQIVDSNGTVVQKIRFDDVTESSPLVFLADVIRALCIIANANTTTPGSYSYQNTHHRSANCSGLTESQFLEISSKIQDLISPKGETFHKPDKGYCYEVTYRKDSNYLYYYIYDNGCANKIDIKP